MRVAGIHVPGGDCALNFLESWRDSFEAKGGRGEWTLAFPAGKPIVAAIIRESARPQVQWASIGDGSFAIVDGEVFVGPEGGRIDLGSG